MIDVSQLDEAFKYYQMSEDEANPETVSVSVGVAYGLTVEYKTVDHDAKFWVSPILTMREKGVALVDKNGFMVANERMNR